MRREGSLVSHHEFWLLTFSQVCTATRVVKDTTDFPSGLLNPEMVTGLIVLHSERCALGQGGGRVITTDWLIELSQHLSRHSLYASTAS